MTRLIAYAHRLHFVAAFEGHSAKHIGELLDVWCRPEWAPTEWGPDERAGGTFDRAAVIKWMTREEGRPGVLRRKTPRWVGGWYALDGGLFEYTVDWEEVPEALAELPFQMADAMAELLSPIWGQVQPSYRGVGPFWNQVTNISGEELVKFGPLGVTARTWIGPHIVKLIGDERLREAPASIRDAAGGVCLELLPEPWKQDAAALAAKQREVVDYLAPAGIWADYSKFLKFKAGFSWQLSCL